MNLAQHQWDPGLANSCSCDHASLWVLLSSPVRCVMETLGVYEGADDVSVSVSRELRMTRRDTLFPSRDSATAKHLGFVNGLTEMRLP